MRFPFLTTREVLDEVSQLSGSVALVFGRERIGLTNVEIAKLDRICSIPASPTYPTLNLGQAVTVVLYELSHLSLSESQHPDLESDLATPSELEDFYAHFSSLLSALA